MLLALVVAPLVFILLVLCVILAISMRNIDIEQRGASHKDQ